MVDLERARGRDQQASGEALKMKKVPPMGAQCRHCWCHPKPPRLATFLAAADTCHPPSPCSSGNHRRLGNQLIIPQARLIILQAGLLVTAGLIHRRRRLGGFLKYYHHAAA